MIGQTKLLSVLSRLIRRASADCASSCAHAKTRQVFRFADNAIHQDLIQDCVDVTVKIVRDKRVGVASAQTLEQKSLSRCLKSALRMARYAPRQKIIAAMPRKHRIRTKRNQALEDVKKSAVQCVASIKQLSMLSRGVGARLAGSLIVGEDEFAVVNSEGLSSYSASSISAAKLVTMRHELSGYASGAHERFDHLKLEWMLKRALRQCLHRREPLTLPAGAYEVILEPEAVAELITWLGYIAFGAKSVEEGTSFLAGKIGKPLMSTHVTIYDDSSEIPGLCMPFDFEGTPRERVVLIDRGKALGPVYDTFYGARSGRPSTGHGMAPDDTDGPLPLHLAMAPGRNEVSDMVGSCRRGLLIPRFNYVNGFLDTRKALMTGLTREGTFLIEHGKITVPVRSMRFTQGILEAFRHVLGVSKDRRLIADPSQDLGGTIAPWLYLARFSFAGDKS